MGTERKHKVVVFTTPSCSWCARTKQYLRAHGIAFKEIDISRDTHAAKDIMRRTGQTGVPVLLIDNRHVVGFNKPLIDRLLDIKPRS
jgi:glutaredoxin-like YruB-family protein